MVINMQCPKCNMNISDDSKMCIHCGTVIQPFANQTPQPVQNNAIQVGTDQQTVVAQPTVEPTVSYKPHRRNYLFFILIPVLIVGVYFAVTTYKKNKEMEAKAQEEFETESGEYFQAAAILTKSKILISEGEDPVANEFYYVLIDNDIKDKEHPLSPKENNDKGYFDGKGYIIIIVGESALRGEGFVCLNNGNTEKRYITLKTLDPYETITGNSNSSFGNLEIDEKGSCDIKELLWHTTSKLHQLTAR